MKKKYLKSSCLFVLVLMLLSVIFPAGAFAQSEVQTTAATTEESVIGVSYRGHVQNLGNVPTPEGTMIAGPEALGTTGMGLRLEGFWIDLTGDIPADADIRYQVHVQNVGWQDAVNGGDFAGTKARGLRIEAIKISLENLPDYDVYYRGHVQNVGNIPQINGDWGWFKNGEELGTTGKGLRLEELQIKIVRKGSDLTAYNTLLNTIEKLDAANYSPESWTVLQTALTDNKMTEANSQASIDAATQAIQAAYDALSLKVVAVYDKPGVYGPETGSQTIEGSVIIDVSGVTLQNLVIKGDLTVSEAVGDGNATLNYLTVEGTTILAGGGTGGSTLAGQATSGDMTLAENSGGIMLCGDILDKVLITKNDHGGIRITVQKSYFSDFEVIDIPEGQPVILNGAFSEVMIQVPDLKLELMGGTSVAILTAGTGDPEKNASGLEVTGPGQISRFTVGTHSDNVTVGADVWIYDAKIYGNNSQFNGYVNNAEIIGNNAGFVSLPEEYTGNPPVILIPVPPPTPGGGGPVLTTPATPAMQANAGAATGAGKFFVSSTAGADNTKTKLTFTYGADFGGALEYAIVANGAASSTGSWADVPATGVQTGDLAATATGDLYVRIKAVSGTSNASAPVKALEDLTVGLTTPTLNTMEASAAAVDAAGKWFVASAAGTDNTNTKLTFSYNGLTLQYAVVTDGTSVSGASWTDVPSTGVQSGDITATATGDLYVRIKAEAGVSNASAPVKALEDLSVGLTTPTLNTMEASAAAVDAAGKWFVASAAGTDNTNTKLTFSYNGLTLQYAVVTDGTSVSGASWTDVPSTGVQSGDITATATGDLYVRIKAEAGVSNASAPVKALDVLAVGLTTPGSSSADLIISGSPRTRIGIVDVEADSGSGTGSSITDPVPLTVSLNVSELNNSSFDPITDNANIYVYLNDGTQITNQDFSSFYPGNTFNFNALNNYLWVKVISENLSTTKYYKIFVQF